MICNSCRYFVDHGPESESGECRRFPPQRGHQAIQNKEKGTIILLPDADFPLTKKNSWCGEYREADAK